MARSPPLSWAQLVSASNRTSCMRRAQSLKPLRVGSGKMAVGEAAVLVPLYLSETGEPSFLYTLRSTSLRSHSGQVSFPGGNKDASDPDLAATALRETEEEVGLDRTRVVPWGLFPPVPSRNYKTSVFPLLAQLEPPLLRPAADLLPNPDEVQEVFGEALDTLCDADRFECATYEVGGAKVTLPVFRGRTHAVWGLTAVITYQVLSCLVPDERFEVLAGKLAEARATAAAGSSRL